MLRKKNTSLWYWRIWENNLSLVHVYLGTEKSSNPRMGSFCSLHTHMDSFILVSFGWSLTKSSSTLICLWFIKFQEKVYGTWSNYCTKAFKSQSTGVYQCCPVLPVWREPPIQFQHLKIYVTSSLGTGLSQVLPKFEPFHFGCITFFQIEEPSDPSFMYTRHIPLC